jgi:hypothetical protein
MFVTLWYPAGETSQELIHAADSRVELGWYDLDSILIPSSQDMFNIPFAHHSDPEQPRGECVSTWNMDGKAHGLYYLNAGNKYLVTRDDDLLNTLRMEHSNLELLRQCSFEARNIKFPEEAIAAAERFQPAALPLPKESSAQ